MTIIILVKFILNIFIFIILTVISQIGGLIFLISKIIIKKWSINFKFKTLIIFLPIYLFSTFLIVPHIAPLFGREKVKHSNYIGPANMMTILLNRNYVKPELNNLLQQTAVKLVKSSIKINYLDANFPFINKFPLLPHLSHNDGKKIDISLIYENKKGLISNHQKSRSGYGVFENPKSNEINQIRECIKNGYFQYDYPKFLTLGKINTDLKFSHQGTKKLVEAILSQNDLGKLFIEPHLKTRLRLKHTKIRYHGCKAVRHDDHIHIQLK